MFLKPDAINDKCPNALKWYTSVSGCKNTWPSSFVLCWSTKSPLPSPTMACTHIESNQVTATLLSVCLFWSRLACLVEILLSYISRVIDMQLLRWLVALIIPHTVCLCSCMGNHTMLRHTSSNQVRAMEVRYRELTLVKLDLVDQTCFGILQMV